MKEQTKQTIIASIWLFTGVGLTVYNLWMGVAWAASAYLFKELNSQSKPNRNNE